VNPYGGKRSGQSIFQTEVLPLIEAAGILYTMQGYIMTTPHFSLKLGALNIKDQSIKKLGQQVTYQESCRNSKITPNMIIISSFYHLELESGSS
jgi:hypothetical protein